MHIDKDLQSVFVFFFFFFYSSQKLISLFQGDYGRLMVLRRLIVVLNTDLR